MSDSLYQSIFMLSPTPAVVLAPENGSYKIVNINEAYRNATGCDKEKNFTGMEFPKFLSRTIFANSISAIIGSLKNLSKPAVKISTDEDNSTVWGVENKLIKNNDGTDIIFHNLIHCEVVDSESGRVDELLEQREYYRSLFTYHPDGVYSLDLLGRFKTVNNSLAKMANLKPEDLYNLHYNSFIPDDELKRVDEHFKNAVSGEIQKFDCQVNSPNGEVRTLNITNVPINVKGKIVGIFGIAQDITDKKNSEEQKRISNERYNYLAKVTNDAIWDWDVEKAIVNRGEGFRELFGIDVNDKSFNTPEHWFSRLHPEDAEKIKRSFLEAQKSSDDHMWHEEYRYQKADGTYAIISDRCLLIRDRQGKAIRMIGAMRDITDQKNAEEELRVLNKKLQAHAAELALSNAELEKFAYIASHDLREPLRMITGFLQILEKKYGSSLDETANMYIEYALNGSSRMQRLIKDLLDYSRISQQDAKKEHVDLNDIMTEVQLNLMRQIEENNVKIVIDKNLPVVVANRSSIVRLFQNLINNAIKFKKTDKNPVITISSREEKKHWTFSIIDNGIGMSEENFLRIFEIFSRLHTRDQYPGSGIGLAICKKIVKQHAGEIWVKSNENEGSSFYFTIPKNPEIGL